VDLQAVIHLTARRSAACARRVAERASARAVIAPTRWLRGSSRCFRDLGRSRGHYHFSNTARHAICFARPRMSRGPLSSPALRVKPLTQLNTTLTQQGTKCGRRSREEKQIQSHPGCDYIAMGQGGRARHYDCERVPTAEAAQRDNAARPVPPANRAGRGWCRTTCHHRPAAW
jgi:hypothetical protein